MFPVKIIIKSIRYDTFSLQFCKCYCKYLLKFG